MLETLTVLGGGGWFPAHARHTACALLRKDSSAIMIDAGTGVGRLAERPELLEGVQRLEIVLTHFHLDHIVGLAYLSAVGAPEQTRVWGPGKQLYDTSTASLLERLAHEPYHPVSFQDQDVEIRELAGDEMELAGMRVALHTQTRHSAPTLGLRFDDMLTWITDTAYDPDSGTFAHSCELLAHEAWWTTEHPRNPDIHSSARQAAKVANQAEVDRLLLIHLPPFERSVAPLLHEAQEVVPQTQLASDGIELSLQMA